MSFLLFSRSDWQIAVFSNDRRFLGVFPAHNMAAQSSKGVWPLGKYPWSHYNEHSEAGLAPGCFTTSYGCDGIHVFAVAGRPGIGVHAGRTFGENDVLGGRTLGCIRIPANAMELINNLHRSDPLRRIHVITRGRLV